MNVKKLVMNNAGLKLLALLLALVTWFYVEETTSAGSKKTVLQKLLTPTDYIAKKLPIKPVFTGKTPAGYRFLESATKITPEDMIVIGPPKIMSKTESLLTKPVDLGEHTKTKMVEVELADVDRSMRFQKTKVQLFLSVESVAEGEGAVEK